MSFSISVGSALFGAALTVSLGTAVPTGADGRTVIGAEETLAGAGRMSGTTSVGAPASGIAEFSRGAGSIVGCAGTGAGWPAVTIGGPTVITGLNAVGEAGETGGGGIAGSVDGGAIDIGGETSVAGWPSIWARDAVPSPIKAAVARAAAYRVRRIGPLPREYEESGRIGCIGHSG